MVPKNSEGTAILAIQWGVCGQTAQSFDTDSQYQKRSGFQSHKVGASIAKQISINARGKGSWKGLNISALRKILLCVVRVFFGQDFGKDPMGPWDCSIGVSWVPTVSSVSRFSV